MKILRIDILNNKALECFNLELNGDNLEIAGSTGAGKTTAISALWNIMEKGSDSLSHGTKKGHIKITLGDGKRIINAERVNTSKTSSIKLTTGHGDKISVGDFKAMLSTLSVNPHKIMDMKPGEQTKTLLKAADLGDFDLDDTDNHIVANEEARLDVGRQMKASDPGERPKKVESVSLTDLFEERKEVEESNRKNQNHRDNLEELKEQHSEYVRDIEAYNNNIDALKQEIVDIESYIKGTEGQVSELAGRIKKGEKYVKKLTDTDPSEIDAKIQSVEETNRNAVVYEQWSDRNKAYKKLVKEYDDLDTAIKDMRETKKKVLDKAKWPIKGLCVEDGKVVYRDCLLENLGESEQMLVCAALAIADIEAHELKVVRIDGVESMSSEDFKALQKLFNKKGIQVLSTRVSRDDEEPQEIVITDGVYES